MNATALYYFFSTIAQVMAAISALLAIFTQFKITEIKDYLIGDGKAVFESTKNTEYGHSNSVIDEQLKSIKDSIDRKSILGIREAIKKLSMLEQGMRGPYPNPIPEWISSLFERFDFKIKQLKNIKKNTKGSIILSFVAILISLVSIIFVELMLDNCFLLYSSVFITFFLVIFSMFFTIKGIRIGLKEIEKL